ncbi:MAG: OmpA family protein [Bacteroidetes bacterium]|nr:OmpA family protein [Bacteroidota bacterium]
MSKLLPSISGVACFIWVTGWTWIFSEGNQATSATSNQTPINILFDSSQYEVQHPFLFKYSEATPIIDENLLPVLKSISLRLSKMPGSKLAITGIYKDSEVNGSSFDNLGLARAEAVKSLLKSSGAADEQILTQGMQAENLFESEGKVMGVIYFNFSEQSFENQVINETKESTVKAKMNPETTSFFYKYGDYKVEKQHLPFLKNLVNELKMDGEKSVTLSGYSAPEEEAASSRINLAEMRAMAVRRYLVDHGVRRAQIDVITKPSMAKSSSEMVVTIQVGSK